MKLALTIGGKAMTPLRALPLISGGLLDGPTIIGMLGEPESYCDATRDTVLAAFTLKPNGVLQPVSHLYFAKMLNRARITGQRDAMAELPAGMVTPLDDAREMYGYALEVASSPQAELATHQQFQWDDEPVLSAAQVERVFEDLPRPRSNSATEIVGEIHRVFALVHHACRNAGFELKPQELPGGMKDWKPIFDGLSERLRRSHGEAFKGHAKRAGLRWRQGRLPADVQRLKAAIAGLVGSAVK